MTDDLLESDAYFNPILQDEPVDVPPEDTTLAPMDRRKLVRRIAADSA